MLAGLLRRTRRDKTRGGGGDDLRYRPVDLPAPVLDEVAPERREHVLAGAQDDDTQEWVVITTWRLVVVDESGIGGHRVCLDRPWYDVDTGAWDPDTGVLSITWVDGARAGQWRLRTRTGPGLVPVSFRERVQSSVVLTKAVDLGPRRGARVVIRTDHRTRDLVEQVIRGRGTRADDAELAAAVLAARIELRDQVGMQPPPV